jgi:alpha-amylase
MRYDWHPRFSLLDHFFRAGTTLEEFRQVDFGEQGDFIDGAFAFEASGRRLRLKRAGAIWVGEERVPVALRKTIVSADGSLRVDIEIENLSERPLSLVYGSEWNLLAFPHELELHGPAGATLYGGALAFAPAGADALWSFALRTLSQSEGGFDIIHQGYCLCPVWSLGWTGAGTKRLSVVLKERHGR